MFDDSDGIIARARKLALVLSTHDPCTNCRHGRLLHKKQMFRDEKLRALDAAMSETQCRHGIGEEPGACECPEWTGTETPFPEWV